VFRFSNTQWHYDAIVQLCTVVFYISPSRQRKVKLQFNIQELSETHIH